MSKKIGKIGPATRCQCGGYMGKPCPDFHVRPFARVRGNGLDESTANELIRRWNAFEEGGVALTMYQHLEFCGWGDRWERECSEEDRISVEEFFSQVNYGE